MIRSVIFKIKLNSSSCEFVVAELKLPSWPDFRRKIESQTFSLSKPFTFPVEPVSLDLTEIDELVRKTSPSTEAGAQQKTTLKQWDIMVAFFFKIWSRSIQRNASRSQSNMICSDASEKIWLSHTHLFCGFCCMFSCSFSLIRIVFMCVFLWFVLNIFLIVCLSVTVKWLAVKTACEMTYTVSGGALNCTLSNPIQCHQADVNNVIHCLLMTAVTEVWCDKAQFVQTSTTWTLACVKTA